MTATTLAPAPTPAAGTRPAAWPPPQLRPATLADLDAVRRFVAGLSADSLHARFFAAGQPPDWMVRRLVERMTSYVAIRGEEVVGIAGYAAYDVGTVDVAVVVADLEQGRGLGPQLVAAAVRDAAANGARRATMSVLADNRPAIAVIRRLWPAATPTLDGGVYDFAVELS